MTDILVLLDLSVLRYIYIYANVCMKYMYMCMCVRVRTSARECLYIICDKCYKIVNRCTVSRPIYTLYMYLILGANKYVETIESNH